MFKFTRETTEYTIDFQTGVDDNLVLCTYILDGKIKWLVVRDTDDLKSVIQYPNQSAIEDNAYAFMENFINTINTELDKKHGEAPTDPQTSKEWVDYIINYELTFDGTHVHINRS